MKKLFMLFAFALVIESGWSLSLDPGEETEISRQMQTQLEAFSLRLPLTDASADLEQYIRDDFTISLRHIR